MRISSLYNTRLVCLLVWYFELGLNRGYSEPSLASFGFSFEDTDYATRVKHATEAS